MRVQPKAVIILPDKEKTVSRQQARETSGHVPRDEAFVMEYGFASAISAVRGKADG
jgi:hypothetical protein